MMNPVSRVILMADDDPDDRLLIQEAIEEAGVNSELYFVEDGEELLQFLRHEGSYGERVDLPLPGLILLDLNMPRKDGREALREIRADHDLRRIPIVILTTSKSEDDIYRTYDMGANSYITKPVSFDSLVRMVELLGRYWLDTVELPQR